MIRASIVLVIAALSLAVGCGGGSGATERVAMPDPLDTVSAEELYARGVVLAEQDDYVRAEQYFAASIERGLPEERVMPALVASCVRSSRLSSALRYAEPFLEHHPDAWSLRLLVATIHMGLGEMGLARNHLLRVTEDRPDEAIPHYMLAVLSRDHLGDGSSADAHFRRYLELAPEGEHAPEARGAVAHPMTGEQETASAGPRPVRLPAHTTDEGGAGAPEGAQAAPGTEGSQ